MYVYLPPFIFSTWLWVEMFGYNQYAGIALAAEIDFPVFSLCCDRLTEGLPTRLADTGPPDSKTTAVRVD